MYAKRIIPCLDVNNGRVVKGTNFVNLRDAGDPVEAAKADLAAAVNENTSAERIEALSDSVASGSYDVSPEMIADSILMF